MNNDPEIELRQRILAPRESIWEACATVQGLEAWQADEVEGEFREGETLTLHFTAFGAAVELDVVAIDPMRRVVLKSGNSVVELLVKDEQLTLVHTGLGAFDDAEGLRSSWRLALVQLAHALEKHPGRPRQVTWVVREIATTAERAHMYFTDPTAMKLWLGESTGIGDVGQSYSLTLKNGETFAGSVLTNIKGRDVALSCRGHNDAMLVLRTLPSPNADSNRLVSLVFSDWDLADADAECIADELEQAVDRLGRILETTGTA